MKPFVFSIIMLSAFSFFACSSSKSVSPQAQQEAQQIEKKIEAKDFTIEVNRALPMRGRSVNLTSSYDIRIKNDSAYAYLPYFGVAQSAPYGGGEGGIKFAEPMKEYTCTPTKKSDGWDIKFKISSADYNYNIFLTVFKNGNSSLVVNADRRDPISFMGELRVED